MEWLLAWLALWPVLAPCLPVEYRAVPHVPYKEAAGEPLTAHLYLPRDRSEPVPAVVFVHGGLWNWGGMTDNIDFAARLAEDGIAAVVIEYRGSAGQGFPEAVEDVRDAVRWIRRNAGEWNFDGDRIGLFGSSSGAHLAGLVAFAGPGEGLGDDPPGMDSRVQACFLLYGVYDLDAMLSSAMADILEDMIGADPESDRDPYARWSPLSYIDGSEPSTAVMHGDRDRLVPFAQAERLVDALTDVGVPATLLRVEGAGHGFARLQRRSRPAVAEAIAHFFRDSL